MATAANRPIDHERNYRLASHEVMGLVSEGTTVRYACVKACQLIGDMTILAKITEDAEAYFKQATEVSAMIRKVEEGA